MKSKYIKIIFLVFGCIYLILFFDTLMSDKNQDFKLLSIHTSKIINLIIYLILALVLIYTSLKKTKSLKK